MRKDDEPKTILENDWFIIYRSPELSKAWILNSIMFMLFLAGLNFYFSF